MVCHAENRLLCGLMRYPARESTVRKGFAVPQVTVSSQHGPELLECTLDFDFPPRSGESLILRAKDGKNHLYRVIECFHIASASDRVGLNAWVVWEGEVGWWAAGEGPPPRGRLLGRKAED